MKDKIISRIDELIAMVEPIQQSGDTKNCPEAFAGTVTAACHLFGPGSVQTKQLLAEKERICDYKWHEHDKLKLLSLHLLGILRSFRKDCEAGLLVNIRGEAKAEVLADFLALAKQSMGSGNKDVAAVLASAALEDALKKVALMHDIAVDDEDMSTVISKLKTSELLGGAEAKVVQSYVQLRNKAFHAEWQKIGEAEVQSLVAFLESFIVTRMINR